MISMKNIHSVLALSAFVFLGAGCAANPLVGTWTNSSNPMITATLQLQGDSSATLSVAGSGSCTGTLSYAGLTWSSTATTITYSGSASCTGSIMCGPALTIDCSTAGAMGQQVGACTYTLGSNNMTLTTTCSGSSAPTTYTRASGG